MSESWDWGRLRQSAAERVLNRHLQDQQEVAEVQAGVGRHHHRHRTGSVFLSSSSEEAERPKTRRHSVPAPYVSENRKGKLLTRRQSRDVSSDDVIWTEEDLRLPSARDQMIHVSTNEEFADDIMARVGGRSGKGSPNLLHQMKSALETERLMEEQRQSFPLNHSAGKQHNQQQQRKDSTSKHRKSLDAQNSERSAQRPPAAVRRISVDEFPMQRLVREETFIHTEKAQILSLDGEMSLPVTDNAAATTAEPTMADTAASNATPQPTPRTTNLNGSNNTEVGQPKNNFFKKKDSVSKPVSNSLSKPERPAGTKNGVMATQSDVVSMNNGGATQTKSDIKATTNGVLKPQPRQQRPGNVQVEFLEEDKGLPKLQKRAVESQPQPIDPQTLSIPIHLLNDDESSDDSVNKENGVRGEKVTDDKGTGVKNKGHMLFMEADGESAWDQARKCHYIRGYDPPDKRMPKHFVGYEFKGGENNTADEQ